MQFTIIWFCLHCDFRLLMIIGHRPLPAVRQASSSGEFYLQKKTRLLASASGEESVKFLDLTLFWWQASDSWRSLLISNQPNRSSPFQEWPNWNMRSLQQWSWRRSFTSDGSRLDLMLQRKATRCLHLVVLWWLLWWVPHAWTTLAAWTTWKLLQKRSRGRPPT